MVMMPLFAFAQVDRSLLIFLKKKCLLKGKIVAHSLEVANISVKNKTANAVTMTDEKGNFRLMAKEKGTLVFSSIPSPRLF